MTTDLDERAQTELRKENYGTYYERLQAIKKRAPNRGGWLVVRGPDGFASRMVWGGWEYTA